MPFDPIETPTPPVMERRVGKLEIAHAELARDFHHMSQAVTKIAEGQETLVSAVNQMVRDRTQLDHLQAAVTKLNDRLDQQDNKADTLTRAVDRNSFVTRLASAVAGIFLAAVITAGVKGWL